MRRKVPVRARPIDEAKAAAALRRAVDLAGGVSALARLAGVSSQMVSAWVAGHKPVSADCAAAIEIALGEVRADELSSLVPWIKLDELLRLRWEREHRSESVPQ
jgi:DNA-binding transcriptional regulator YdaS (Cro superfamily)